MTDDDDADVGRFERLVKVQELIMSRAERGDVEAFLPFALLRLTQEVGAGLDSIANVLALAMGRGNRCGLERINRAGVRRHYRRGRWKISRGGVMVT